MPHSTHGTITLMGSGETAPSMVEVHKYAMSLVEGKVRAAFVDTPAGFQLNADGLAEKAISYFEERLHTELTHVRYKHAKRATREETQTAVNQLHRASYIFAGPGSPSYAIDNWRRTPVLDAIAETLTHGGCLTFASAAALTLGQLTIPVYEIYKVGGEVRWIEGLDVLGHYGLNVAIVPHWNNKSGGDHDTRFCFMGEPRWEHLRDRLPENVAVLGIDEHTACILRPDDNRGEVRGNGAVTVIGDGERQTFAAGERFSLDLLRMGERGERRLTASEEDTEPPDWETIREKHEALRSNTHPALETITDYAYDVLALLSASREKGDWQTMQQAEDALREVLVGTLATLNHDPVDEDKVIAPYVELLINIRVDLRANEQWALADRIRDDLLALGVEVQDTPDGAEWERIE